jgi:hypothetical protein
MAERDRRSRIRHHLECPVTMITSQGTMVGQTLNLSGEGAFISCHQPFKRKETLDLSIELPDGFLMQVPAQVVWYCLSSPAYREGLNGMGVRFLWSALSSF